MRFLVYTLLFLLIPFAGFTQIKQTYASPQILNTDTSNLLEKNGNTPPPQVMVGANDQCGGTLPALNNTAPTSTVMTGPVNGFAAQTTTNDPFQIIWTNTTRTAWVSYTPTSAGSLSVTLTSAAAATGLNVVIFSGGCPSFTGASYTGASSSAALPSVIGSGASGVSSSSTGPATATTSCLVPNVTYYIMVGSVSAGAAYTVSTTFNGAATNTPANNCCMNAQDVSANLNGSAITGGTTASATNDAPFLGGCNTAHNNVWYSFVAQGPNVEITVAGAANLGPEFQLLTAAGTNTDVCTGTSVTSVTCNTATSATATANNLAGTTLVTGQTYYVSVTSTLTAGGPFTLTVNNPTPNPPGTNCANATFLCSTSLPYKATGGNTNLWGYEDEDGTTGDCIGTNGEVHSAWYYFQIASGTTLNLNIATTSAVNYDFSIWKYTVGTSSPLDGICDHLSSTLVNCNSSPTASTSTGFNATGVTTFTNSGSTINSQLTVATGDVYAIMVNSPAIGAGTYTISTSGTASLTCVNNIILPIELADFTATQNNNEVDLKWATVTETNNSYFTVERSVDGKTFEELNKVKSIAVDGSSKNILHYTDVDNEPLPGVSYYRLSQTDLNGKTNKLTITSVANKDNDGAFIIAPNPTDGVLNITYSCQTATTGTFRLYDGNGILILEQNVVCALGNNKTQIDINDKQNGIYFATFTTNSSFYRTKLIKK